MSGNDPRSRQFISEHWHYTSLSNTAPLNNVLDTFPSAFDLCGNATPASGESYAPSPPKSRDMKSSPARGPGSSHAAWGFLGFSTFANDPLDMGAIGNTEARGITTTLAPPGDFQGWTTQHPPQSEVWGSSFDSQSIPVSAISNAWSVDDFSQEV